MGARRAGSTNIIWMSTKLAFAASAECSIAALPASCRFRMPVDEEENSAQFSHELKATRVEAVGQAGGRCQFRVLDRFGTINLACTQVTAFNPAPASLPGGD